MNERTHASLLALAGGYIIYLAYEILRDHLNGEGGMSDAIAILSVTVLFLGGLGALYYAWRVYRQSKKPEEQQKDDQSVK